MKRIALSCVLMFTALSFLAQDEVPSFTRIPVGTTGCELYSPGGSMDFELSYSEDSSEVWVGSAAAVSHQYEVICIKFKEILGEDKREYEMMLTSYMDYLQSQFQITSTAGYGFGHELESHPEAEGVIDFWVDSENNQWRVKGWADAHYMAILFIWGSTEVNEGIAQTFLNGFRFPE